MAEVNLEAASCSPFGAGFRGPLLLANAVVHASKDRHVRKRVSALLFAKILNLLWENMQCEICLALHNDFCCLGVDPKKRYVTYGE